MIAVAPFNFWMSDFDSNQFYINLSLDDIESPDWIKAIEVFERRFRTRFFKPLQILIDQQKISKQNSESDKSEFYCGFLVMAIDCMLIETFNQFKFGADSTEDMPLNIQESFIDFLTGSIFFNDFFDIKRSECFYDHVRNGILHQGETKGGTILTTSSALVEDTNGGLRLNRIEFHKRLEEYFKDYIEKLKDSNNEEMRRKFQMKMDFISRKVLPPTRSERRRRKKAAYKKL
jgi:hypothetical protein